MLQAKPGEDEKSSNEKCVSGCVCVVCVSVSLYEKELNDFQILSRGSKVAHWHALSVSI